MLERLRDNNNSSFYSAYHCNSSLILTLVNKICNDIIVNEKTTETWRLNQFRRYNLRPLKRWQICIYSDYRISHFAQRLQLLLGYNFSKNKYNLSKLWLHTSTTQELDLFQGGNRMNKTRKRSKVQDTDYKSNLEIIQDWEEQNDRWVRNLGPK